MLLCGVYLDASESKSSISLFEVRKSIEKKYVLKTKSFVFYRLTAAVVHNKIIARLSLLNVLVLNVINWSPVLH